jgi:hypothetical protein
MSHEGRSTLFTFTTDIFSMAAVDMVQVEILSPTSFKGRKIRDLLIAHGRLLHVSEDDR